MEALTFEQAIAGSPWVLQRELEEQGALPEHANHVADAARQFADMGEALLDKASEIRTRVDRAVHSVEAQMHVNSLGELQGSAAQFDIFCARREDASASLQRAIYLFNKAHGLTESATA